MRKKEGNRWVIPVFEHPEGNTILIFTTKKQIRNEAYKSYKTAKTTLPELMQSFEPCELLTVIINADTDSLTLPVNLLNKMFEAFDYIENMVDDKMQNGIPAAQLDEIVFERFAGHRLESKMIDGGVIQGAAFRYGNDEEYGSYHDVIAGGGATVRIYKNQIEFIRDTTLLGD